MNKKTIYLPIEIKVRELTSFILLSLFAVEKNYRIYLGSKPAIRELIEKKKNKSGIFIFKGGMETEDILKIKNKVDKFIILDQEISPSCIDFKKEMRRRIWPGSEEFIDRYYLLGQRAYDAGVEVLSKLKDKIVNTGWPSIDLSRDNLRFFYSEKVKEIKNKFGDFILFSSAFSYNSKKKIDDVYQFSKKHEWQSVRDSLEEDMIWAEYTLLEFNKNIELLREIDKNPDCPQIIVRPHPSEDHQEWEKIAKTFNRIKVIFDGEISPWIYAARGLLHRGCASSIQAYMAGIPIGYPLLSQHTIKKALPYEISEHLFSSKEVIEFCKKNIDKPPVSPKLYTDEFNKVVNIKDKYACEVIIEDINKLDVSHEPIFEFKITFKNYLLHIFRSILKLFKKSISENLIKYRKTILLKHSIRIAPQAQKMPGGISKIDVKDMLDKLQKFNTSFANKKIVVREVYKDCIEIEGIQL